MPYADSAERRMIPTGYESLDHLLGGLERRNVSLVASRPSVGKSALALNVVHKITELGYNALYISLATPKEQLLNRLIASQTGLMLSKITIGDITQQERETILRTATELRRYRFVDAIESQVETLVQKIQYENRKQSLDLVVIDGIHRLDRKMAKWPITQALQHLKKVAYRTDSHIMMLGSVIERDVEQRNDGQPTLLDLWRNEDLAIATDVILLLSDKRDQERDALIIEVAQHINGPLGQVTLFYDKSIQRID